jgi:hypothetical protein
MKFYSDEIQVEFSNKPLLEKKSGVPAAFSHRGQRRQIVELLSEWHDYKRGDSWGKGRDYYRIRCDDGNIYEIYYDRQPKGRKKGRWILYQELREEENRK